MTAFTRCKLGMNRRLVMAVTCVPMPPFFLALPLRQICEPLMGPLPVNSQIRAIKLFVQKRTGESINFPPRCKGYFPHFASCSGSVQICNNASIGGVMEPVYYLENDENDFLL